MREVRLREPASELMLLSAAVLLDRARLEAFAAALARAAARDAAGLHIDCVGPLPPFTFAELRI